jgi:hypothetical protein
MLSVRLVTMCRVLQAPSPSSLCNGHTTLGDQQPHRTISNQLRSVLSSMELGYVRPVTLCRYVVCCRVYIYLMAARR